MNRTLLRKIYKIHGIRKKRYRWTKKAKGMDAATAYRKFVTMKQQITKNKNAGFRFVYIDETMFTRTSMPTTEWTMPKQNYELDQKYWNEPALALLMGISYENGSEHY